MCTYTDAHRPSICVHAEKRCRHICTHMYAICRTCLYAYMWHMCICMDVCHRKTKCVIMLHWRKRHLSDHPDVRPTGMPALPMRVSAYLPPTSGEQAGKDRGGAGQWQVLCSPELFTCLMVRQLMFEARGCRTWSPARPSLADGPAAWRSFAGVQKELDKTS